MERKDPQSEDDEREEEQEALHDLERDEAENYGFMFGKMEEDSAQAEVDEAERDKR